MDYMMGIYLEWLILPGVPLTIGLLAVLALGKLNEKAARIVCFIALGLSVISLLYGLWVNLWIAGWNSELAVVRLLDFVGILVLGVQAVLLGINYKKVKVRRIITLTLMATPLLFVPLIFVVGDMLGVEIVMD